MIGKPRMKEATFHQTLLLWPILLMPRVVVFYPLARPAEADCDRMLGREPRRKGARQNLDPMLHFEAGPSGPTS
jgi:hypothetical protein